MIETWRKVYYMVIADDIFIMALLTTCIKYVTSMFYRTSHACTTKCFSQRKSWLRLFIKPNTKTRMSRQYMDWFSALCRNKQITSFLLLKAYQDIWSDIINNLLGYCHYIALKELYVRKMFMSTCIPILIPSRVVLL